MNISITFDVEVWCGGWKNLDARFPAAFERYVYGENRRGHALPYTRDCLDRHGLKAVIFVEPLFASRFGHECLHQIVSLIATAVIEACGVPRPSAFRAGRYVCNRDTWRALAANGVGIGIDSSMNAPYPRFRDRFCRSARRQSAARVRRRARTPRHDVSRRPRARVPLAGRRGRARRIDQPDPRRRREHPASGAGVAPFRAAGAGRMPLRPRHRGARFSWK